MRHYSMEAPLLTSMTEQARQLGGSWAGPAGSTWADAPSSPWPDEECPGPGPRVQVLFPGVQF